MADDLKLDELLAAYVSGDLSPDERAAVELRLANDPQFRDLSQDLAEISAVLKQGERPVSAEMLKSLRERIAQALEAEVSPAALLSASLSGDVSKPEADALKQYLAATPAAKRELQSLNAFSTFLKQGEKPVSDAALAKLADRIRARLPQPTASARRVPVSARVYAVEPPPSRRIAWIGLAAAAAVVLALLGFAAAKLLQSAPPSEVAVPQPVDQQQFDPLVAPLPPVPQPEIVENITPVPQPPVPENVVPRNVVEHRPDQAPPRNLPEVVRNQPDSQTPAPGPQPAPPEVVQKVEPHQAVPEQPEQPRDTQVAQPQPAPQNPRNPNSTHNTGVAVALNNPSTTPATNPSTTPATLPEAAPTDTKIATSDPANDEIAPVANKAVVGVLRGNVQATLPDGTRALRLRDQLPSGAELVTDQGKVVLVLPGGAKLAVNSNSSIGFELHEKNVTVVLKAGEINYQGAAGALSLIADNVVVNGAKGIDVRREGNKLVASVTTKSAQVGPKGKTVVVKAGAQATVLLGTDAAPAIQSFTGQPDAWTADLVLPGSGGSSDQKVPTDDRAKPRSSSRRR